MHDSLEISNLALLWRFGLEHSNALNPRFLLVLTSLIQDMNKREKKMYIMYKKVETIYQQNNDLLQNTILRESSLKYLLLSYEYLFNFRLNVYLFPEEL